MEYSAPGDDGTALLEHADADPVVNHAAPIQCAYQMALIRGETGFLEEQFLIGVKPRAATRG